MSIQRKSEWKVWGWDVLGVPESKGVNEATGELMGSSIREDQRKLGQMLGVVKDTGFYFA